MIRRHWVEPEPSEKRSRLQQDGLVRLVSVPQRGGALRLRVAHLRSQKEERGEAKTDCDFSLLYDSAEGFEGLQAVQGIRGVEDSSCLELACLARGARVERERRARHRADESGPCGLGGKRAAAGGRSAFSDTWALVCELFAEEFSAAEHCAAQSLACSDRTKDTRRQDADGVGASALWKLWNLGEERQRAQRTRTN